MIDVKSILIDLGVDFKESGKNVGANDCNIDCPFCGSSKHLGISLNNGYTFCWVCEFSDLERHPSLIKVLMESTGEAYDSILQVLLEHGYTKDSYMNDNLGAGLASKAYLPKEAVPIMKLMPWKQPSDYAIFYLSERGFNMDIVKKYNLMFCKEGNYSNRIIIPIFFNGKIVSFTSRSIKDGERYKHAPLYMSSMRIKNLLYNYDIAKKYSHVYLLEGPTDVWRMGNNAMAVFRSKISRDQRNLLVKLTKEGLTSLTIIFDYGAIGRAYEAAGDLSPFIRKIKVVRLPSERDVADRTRNQVIRIERETPLFVG